MRLKIGVAMHKRAKIPSEKCYFPLYVGKAGSPEKLPPGYIADDTGDHISDKNPHFCELTGLYWMWKNLNAEYVGLVHYRRYFTSAGFKHGKNILDHVLSEEKALEILSNYDLILSKKRRYYIETVASHYIHTHFEEHLTQTREILAEREQDYVETFDKVMKRRSAHMYNMFVASKETCDEYCAWLFPILSELEEKTDFSGYTPFQARMVGRIGEILLDVWVTKNQKSYCEVPVSYVGREKILKKGLAFLKAKFFGKKYDSSF